MSLYQQTTEAAKYLKLVASLAPQTLAAVVQKYKINRALYLGLPIGYPATAQAGARQVSQPKINLRARIAARGTDVAGDLAGSVALKTFSEAQAAIAITALGGAGSILATSEWGFLLDDIAGGTYALPGIPFNVPAIGAAPAYTVTLTVNQDGSASVAFTAADGSTISPDPM